MELHQSPITSHQSPIRQIHQSLEPILGSNATLDDGLDKINILVTEAIRTVYEIEKTLGTQITYAINTTREQNATQIMEDINIFKYYVEGISLTTIGIIGIVGKQYTS